VTLQENMNIKTANAIEIVLKKFFILSP